MGPELGFHALCLRVGQQQQQCMQETIKFVMQFHAQGKQYYY